MQSIAIIDYGMGNLRSVANAFAFIAQDKLEVKVTSDKAYIEQADKVVFPGQGAAKDCMAALKEHDLLDILPKLAQEKPFLGICMGLQVLFSKSLENNGIDCLHIYSGQVNYLGDVIDKSYKIPHMGWNQVTQTQEHPLWHSIPNQSRFYFVHSYYVLPDNKDIITGQCNYGTDFTIAIAKDYLFAVQFHPEKSADHGLQLLTNFIDWNGK